MFFGVVAYLLARIYAFVTTAAVPVWSARPFECRHGNLTEDCAYCRECGG